MFENKRIPCKHCGTPFDPSKIQQSEFCCNGCAYVFKLIQQDGLDAYYKLRDKKISPIKQSNLHPKDYQWLKALIAPLENECKHPELLLDLEGISCIGCVWLVEKIFNDFAGAESIEINSQYGQIRIKWIAGVFQPVEFAKTVQQYGYLIGPAGDRSQKESRRLIMKIGLCGAFALNAMLFTLPSYLGMEASFFLADLFQLLTLLFATLSLFIGGSYFIKRAFASIRHRLIHIDLPIAIGIIGSYTGSIIGWISESESFLYFDFVSIFIFLMLCGRWLQESALERNRNKLVSSNKFTQEFIALDDQLKKETKIPLRGIEPNQILRINPGEIIPVLAECVHNKASLSLEWINGESEMRNFTKGSLIPAGSQNIGIEPILVITQQTWKESLLKRLINDKPFEQKGSLFEKVLKAYLGSVLFIALAVFVFWVSIGSNLKMASQAMLSILVVSCPCALGVAIPLTEELILSRLRAKGIFLQNLNVFRHLESIKHFIFDKTGTLTIEAPTLENTNALSEINTEDLEVLKRMTRLSLHPISRALRDALLEYPGNKNTNLESGVLTEEVGLGLIWQSGSSIWTLGRPQWKDDSINSNDFQCIFSKNGRFITGFNFQESIRENAKECIQSLKQDYTVSILSGDRSNKVQAMAKELGIDTHMALAEQSPQEKEDWVKQIGAENTFYIGDGANDALAFRSSAIRGTPATPNGLLQKDADFFFTGTNLAVIIDLIKQTKTRKSLLQALFCFSISYNLIAISIAATGHMHPLLAAIIMPLSSLATLGIIGLFKQSD